MHANVKITGGSSFKRSYSFTTVVEAPSFLSLPDFVHRLELFAETLKSMDLMLEVQSVSSSHRCVDGSPDAQARRMRDEAAFAQMILERGVAEREY